MDTINSLPQENFDRANQNQANDSAAPLFNWTAQDNQSFRTVQSGQTGDLTLTNNLSTIDQEKPEVERTGHRHDDVGARIVGGIIGGIAAEVLFGGHRPYYPPPVYRQPYPNYPEPYYPRPYPVPVPGWGHGGHHNGNPWGGGHHGGHNHGGHNHGGHNHGGHRGGYNGRHR